jgi:hypothetical protein
MRVSAVSKKSDASTSTSRASNAGMKAQAEHAALKAKAAV